VFIIKGCLENHGACVSLEPTVVYCTLNVL